jgi:hypothetical protein
MNAMKTINLNETLCVCGHTRECHWKSRGMCEERSGGIVGTCQCRRFRRSKTGETADDITSRLVGGTRAVAATQPPPPGE